MRSLRVNGTRLGRVWPTLRGHRVSPLGAGTAWSGAGPAQSTPESDGLSEKTGFHLNALPDATFFQDRRTDVTTN